MPLLLRRLSTSVVETPKFIVSTAGSQCCVLGLTRKALLNMRSDKCLPVSAIHGQQTSQLNFDFFFFD
jgi:hypothetical protein